MNASGTTLRDALDEIELTRPAAQAVSENPDSPLMTMSVANVLDLRNALLSREVSFRGFSVPILKQIFSHLDEAGYSHAGAARAQMNARQQDDARVAALAAVFRVLALVPFPEALMEADPAIRLRRILEDFVAARDSKDDWRAGVRTLADLLSDWKGIMTRLQQADNFGAKSTTDLKLLVDGALLRATEAVASVVSKKDVAAERLNFAGILAGDIPEPLLHMIGRADLDKVRAALPTFLAEPAHHLLGGSHGRKNRATELPGFPGVIMRNEKQAQILAMRYGFFDKPATLDVVSNTVGITKERVRQIEVEAVKHLGRDPSRQKVEPIIEAHLPQLIEILTDGTGYLPDEASGEINRKAMIAHGVPGTVVLGLEALFPSASDLANRYGTRQGNGWLLGLDDKARGRAQATSKLLSTRLRGRRNAILVSDAMEAAGATTSEISAAVAMVPGAAIVGRHIIRDIDQLNERRAYQLYDLAIKLDDGAPFDLTRLCEAYAAATPEENNMPNCVPRAIAGAKGMFLNVIDRIWFPLQEKLPERPAGHAPLPYTIRPDMSQTSIWRRPFGENTVAHFLHGQITRHGPIRTLDLAELTLPENYGSRSETLSGAQPIMKMNPNFVHLSPGIYGLVEQLPKLTDPRRALPEVFLADRIARAYADARRVSPAAARIYPIWDMAFEYRLARWAAEHANKKVAGALFDVVDPRMWPIAEDEVARWQAVKAEMSDRKQHHQAEQPDEYALPPADRFLASMITLWWMGEISWTLIGRTTNQRDMHTPASHLALLARFGLARAPKHWQDRHLPTADLRPTLEAVIRDAVHADGISWRNPEMRALLSRDAGPGGWVDNDAVSRALQRPGDPQLSVYGRTKVRRGRVLQPVNG